MQIKLICSQTSYFLSIWKSTHSPHLNDHSPHVVNEEWVGQRWLRQKKVSDNCFVIFYLSDCQLHSGMSWKQKRWNVSTALTTSFRIIPSTQQFKALFTSSSVTRHFLESSSGFWLSSSCSFWAAIGQFRWIVFLFF